MIPLVDGDSTIYSLFIDDIFDLPGPSGGGDELVPRVEVSLLRGKKSADWVWTIHMLGDS